MRYYWYAAAEHVDFVRASSPHVTMFFQFGSSGRSKSRLAKAAGTNVQSTSASEHFWKLKCRKSVLWRGARFQVKMYKAHQGRSTFGSCHVEKVHAGVARSTFPSQNVQSTSVSDRFWKLTCRKSARRCGAKHISKSKVQKLTGSEHF